MLKEFRVKNFKNFKEDIGIKFENVAGYQFGTDCITEGCISKMLIYGRNATGKTNLGKALMDIQFTLFGEWTTDQGILLNADTEEAAEFSYEFRFQDKEVVYRYSRCSGLRLDKEELLVDGTVVFCWDFVHKKHAVDNLACIGAETANTERYLQSIIKADEGDIMNSSIDGFMEPLPFLKWLLGNVAFGSDSVVIRLSDYVKRMSMITAGNLLGVRYRRENDRFFEALEKTEKLHDLEEFLNVMGIECRLVLRKLPDNQRELYFAHEKLLPFYKSASSGTLALADLYRRLILPAGNMSFLYLDEFDAFYHYEMAENVVRFLKKKYPECQMIFTTHNTNLMTNRLMRPDCLFILSGIGKLTALCDATQRELREGHNLEKMYISGEFQRYE